VQELLVSHFDRLESLLLRCSCCPPPQFSHKESLLLLPTASELSTRCPSQPKVADVFSLQQASAEESSDLKPNCIAAEFEQVQDEGFRATVTTHAAGTAPRLEEPHVWTPRLEEPVLHGSKVKGSLGSSSSSPDGKVHVERSRLQSKALAQSIDCLKTPLPQMVGDERLEAEHSLSSSPGTRPTTRLSGNKIYSAQPAAAFAGLMEVHEATSKGDGVVLPQLKALPVTGKDNLVQIQQIPACELFRWGPDGNSDSAQMSCTADPACQDSDQPLIANVSAARTEGSVATLREPPWLGPFAGVNTVPGSVATVVMQADVPMSCSGGGCDDFVLCGSAEKEHRDANFVILAKDETAYNSSRTWTNRNRSCSPGSLREGSTIHNGIWKSLLFPGCTLAGSSSRGSPQADSAVTTGALAGQGPLVADLVWYLPGSSVQLASVNRGVLNLEEFRTHAKFF
jgi:hypothetical protein